MAPIEVVDVVVFIIIIDVVVFVNHHSMMELIHLL